MNRLRSTRTRPLAIVVATTVVLVGVLAPVGAALAGEIMPGVDVLAVTVTGPGLSEPVPMSDEDAVVFMKGVVAGGLFVPQVAVPPEDAEVYTARYTTVVQGNPGHGKVLFAWDGQNAWVSGAELLERGEYMVAGPAMVEAMADVLAQVKDHPRQDSSSEDAASNASESDNSWNSVAIGAVVAVVVVVGAVVAWLLVRRRRATPTG